MTEWSEDGCPNDCGWCKKHGYSCIYKDSDSPLKIKKFVCCSCGKKLASDETYEYKGFIACEDCLESVTREVEDMIQKSNESIDSRQIVKGMPHPVLQSDLAKSFSRQFKSQLEVQGKESIYEKKLREGKLL